jgi:hypothetical protein
VLAQKVPRGQRPSGLPLLSVAQPAGFDPSGGMHLRPSPGTADPPLDDEVGAAHCAFTQRFDAQSASWRHPSWHVPSVHTVPFRQSPSTLQRVK